MLNFGLSLGNVSDDRLGCGTSPMCMLIGAHATQPTRWIGYDDRDGVTPYGDRSPNTVLGQPVRLHNFDTSTGASYIRFGEDEETQIPNVQELVYVYGGYVGYVVYPWNSVEGRYEVIDQALCDFMLTQVGEVVGFAQPLTYLAYMRIDVVGRISSFTRGGDFEILVDAVPMVFNTNFRRFGDSGMNYNSAEIDQFMGGGNPSVDIVNNNASGYMDVLFEVDTKRIDEITVSGRPTADSTQFRFRVWDNNGTELYNSGLNIVTDKETIQVGLDLT